MERVRFCAACGESFEWRRKICTHCGHHKDEPIRPCGVLDYVTEVVGESFQNDDGTSRQSILQRCSRGMEIDFLWEKGNRYDKWAVRVSVITRRGHEQVGYLPRGRTREFVERQMSCWSYSARINAIEGGYEGAPSLGVWILVMEIPPGIDHATCDEWWAWRSR